MPTNNRLPYRMHLDNDPILTDLVDRAVRAVEDLEAFIGRDGSEVSRKAGMAALAGVNQAVSHLSNEVHVIKSEVTE